MCRAPPGEVPPEPRVPPDGARVRSMGEAGITTTLHLAKVAYQYEAEFPIPEEHRWRSGSGYYPDFYLPDEAEEAASVLGGIWLEHFATNANGELPERWDEDESGATAKYREQRRWKEQLHASLGPRFTFTEFGDIQRCMRERTSFPDLLLQRIGEQV